MKSLSNYVKEVSKNLVDNDVKYVAIFDDDKDIIDTINCTGGEFVYLVAKLVTDFSQKSGAPLDEVVEEINRAIIVREFLDLHDDMQKFFH